MSMHLSNDRILWGHVLLEDTENPDAHLAQILVRPIDVEPGYELYDRTNTVLSDLTVPAVREANRIVQTLLIPASEIARREKAVRAVIHSGYLEGFPDDMPWQSQLWMYARGEVTREQLSAYADEGGQIPRQPEHSAVGPADVPEDWWQPHKPASAGTCSTQPSPRRKSLRPCRSALRRSVSCSKRTG
ncbi:MULTISPECIES: antitoxin VbhA family protein [unclassified Curtobacterium]|uniref:antitoxin VbhA family protein n=1 Tax=unclassified Curtobacterium TaxID=257496 RepID=UPI00226B736D|nr:MULTISPECIES: antitoxin VbhA family protein [unclassified Curtobacterium]